jgi:hypothetical protein
MALRTTRVDDFVVTNSFACKIIARQVTNQVLRRVEVFYTFGNDCMIFFSIAGTLQRAPYVG